VKGYGVVYESVKERINILLRERRVPQP
jgi:hypothetical protein